MNATKQQQCLCFLLAYRRVDNCLQAVSRAALVLSAVREHWNFVLPASGLGTHFQRALVVSLSYQDL